MWGDARASYDVRSRRKRKRRSHIVLADPAHPARRVKVPYAEYPAPMVFYKMGRAGLLEGLPDTVDVSKAWQFVAITDEAKAKAFEQKFGVPLTARFRHMPESFARLLAKIGYCNLLTVLGPGIFGPSACPTLWATVPIHPASSAARSKSPSWKRSDIGSAPSASAPPERVMLVAEIRLFANVATPHLSCRRW